MKAIVFDLDGTLIDSAPDLQAAGNQVLAAEGLPQMTPEHARSFIGNGAGVFVERMLAAAGLPADAARHGLLLGRFLALYETAVHQTTLYPGVAGALLRLRAEGWHLGLCTNKPLGPTQAVLNHFGMGHTFAAMVCGDSLPQRKPHPAPLLATAAALGQGPALYVGDSEVDAECATRAGMDFALYTMGYRKTAVDSLPHKIAFSEFARLPDLAAQWWQAA